MTERKYRYRIPPCADYDIPAMESWLEDMAARGLHLSQEGFFMGLGIFEEGPPKQVRYRLEATATRNSLFSKEFDPDDDAIQMLRQMGWVYRARRGQFHIYCAEDPSAPELNTDPRVQALTMAALGKFLRKNLCSTLALTALYLLTIYGDILASAFVTVGSWRMGLLVGLLLWDLGRDIYAIFKLARIRKALQNGDPLPHRSDYKTSGVGYLTLNGVRKGAWAVLLCAMLFFLFNYQDMKPLEQQDLPFATLENIYPDAEVTHTDGILKNEVRRWEDLLAPDNVEFTEFAEITLDGKTFDSYLTIRYHETRWEWVARRLAAEMIGQAGGDPYERAIESFFGGEPLEVTELTIPGADFCAYFYKNLPDPYLVIQTGCVVMKVRLADFSGGEAMEPAELAQIILSQIR